MKKLSFRENVPIIISGGVTTFHLMFALYILQLTIILTLLSFFKTTSFMQFFAAIVIL